MIRKRPWILKRSRKGMYKRLWKGETKWRNEMILLSQKYRK